MSRQQYMPCVPRVHEAMFVEQVAVASHLSFKSINGATSTKHVACIPSSLGPRGCILRPAVFDEGDTKGAPFLLSLPFLLRCRAQLCLDPVQGLELYLSKYKHRVPLHIGPSGSLRVCLQDFQGDMKEDLAHALKSIAVHECSHMSISIPESDRLSSQPPASISSQSFGDPLQHDHGLQEKPRGKGGELPSPDDLTTHGAGAETAHHPGPHDASSGLLQHGHEHTASAAKPSGPEAQTTSVSNADQDLNGQLHCDRRLHGQRLLGQSDEVFLRTGSGHADHREGGPELRQGLPSLPTLAAADKMLSVLRVDLRTAPLDAHGEHRSLAGIESVDTTAELDSDKQTGGP